MQTNRILTLGCTILGLLPAAAHAADHRQNYQELAAFSDKIVVGSVSAKSSHWGDDSRIYTDALIIPDVTIKGAEEGVVPVQMLGGTVGDTTMTVSDGPDFPDSERVVVFLKREAGHFVVAGRAAGSVRATAPEAAEAVDGAFASVERLSGQRAQYKRGLAAIYVGRASRGGTNATTSAAQVGCYNVDGAKWSTTSANYRIGASIPAGWAASIDASAATWSNAGVPFRLVNDSASTNELSYKDLVAAYGSSYSNTYAVTTTWSSTSTGRISRATVEINNKWQWSTSGEANKADLQNIMTHEFGHWMRLLDIYSPSTCGEVTMWGSAAYGETKKRTLDQADIDGFSSLYGSGGSTTISAPTLTSPANGATGISSTPALTWSAVSGATAYDVYFGTATTPALVGTVTSTSFQPGSLTVGARYYWRVAAKNSTATASSSTFSFTVAGASLSGPTLTAPANGATGVSSTPALTWSAVSGATAYDVYFGTATSPALVATVTGNTVQPGSLTAGATYYWRVVARNSTSSASSSTFSFTVAGTSTSGPTLISPANSATGVSLIPVMRWSAVSGAIAYDLYVGTSTSPSRIGTVYGTSVTVRGFQSNTVYYWKVVARTATSSPSSATASFRTN